MTDAVESRAAIINDYVTAVEEYMTAFALGREVRELLAEPQNPALVKKRRNTQRILLRSKVFLKACTSLLRIHMY